MEFTVASQASAGAIQVRFVPYAMDETRCTRAFLDDHVMFVHNALSEKWSKFAYRILKFEK